MRLFKKLLGIESPSGRSNVTGVDRKFEKLGYLKMEDSRNVVFYDRYDNVKECSHRLLLMRGRTGMPTIASVKKGDNGAHMPLPVIVIRLALAKIKEKRWEGLYDG